MCPLLSKVIKRIGFSECGRMFGCSRQAVFHWLSNGLPWVEMEMLAEQLATVYQVKKPDNSPAIPALSLITESTKHKRYGKT